MAIVNLNFSPDNGGRWKATYTSTGNTTVQIERKAKGCMSVYAHIDGMKPVLLGTYPEWTAETFLALICAPIGMTVDIYSASEVIMAKSLTEE